MTERPVALVTGTVSDYRREPFRLLGEELGGIEVLAWDHDGTTIDGVPVRDVSQRAVGRLIAGGRYRAVIGGLGGRVALPAAYLGAKRARVPFVLWASLWEHPSTLVHRVSSVPLRAIYRGADAVATYGPHVSAYVESRRGSRGNVFVAPQAVDVAHFGRAVDDSERAAARERAGAGPGDFLLLFAGRLETEKGVDVLLEAWRSASLGNAALAFAGTGPIAPSGERVTALGRVDRAGLPALYAAADAVVLPSIPTATFKEPWGLVINEAMHQGTPVISSDAVGAAAGGLVHDQYNGLVVPHSDAEALARAIRRIGTDTDLRGRLGAAAKADVAAYTPAAWASGMSRAVHAAEAGRVGSLC